MNDNIELTLHLSVQKVNLVLSALGQLPYVQVAQIIGEIKAQADTQVKAMVEVQ